MPSALTERRKMPKIKTKKSISKRVKVTASGKMLRRKAGKRHLLSGKTSKRKKALGKNTLISRADEKRVRRMIPYN